MEPNERFPTEEIEDFSVSVRKMREAAEAVGMSLQEYLLYWLYVETINRPSGLQITFDDDDDPVELVEEGA